jgi:hypothetical protein
LYGAWQIYFEQLAAKRDGVFVSYRRSDIGRLRGGYMIA